jgi:hypothetical protein
MAAAMQKTYKCLNPVGIDEPVAQFPLAPRLDTLDGKTIHLSICGEADIWVPLEKRLRSDEEERKTTDAVILGVCW